MSNKLVEKVGIHTCKAIADDAVSLSTRHNVNTLKMTRVFANARSLCEKLVRKSLARDEKLSWRQDLLL